MKQTNRSKIVTDTQLYGTRLKRQGLKQMLSDMTLLSLLLIMCPTKAPSCGTRLKRQGLKQMLSDMTLLSLLLIMCSTKAPSCGTWSWEQSIYVLLFWGVNFVQIQMLLGLFLLKLSPWWDFWSWLTVENHVSTYLLQTHSFYPTNKVNLSVNHSVTKRINKQWQVIALEQLTSHMTLNAGPQQQRLDRVAYDNSTWHAMNTTYINSTKETSSKKEEIPNRHKHKI